MSNKVYEAIVAVAADMAATGISKDKRASAGAGGSYNFRGIDDVYNNLAPLLAKHKLCILPRCIERTVTERTNAKGTALFYVTVHAEFDMVSAEDGSKHTVSTFGEAMDTGDKATNKAMSAAYKYAAFQAFCIPTEETAADADSETHSGIRPANDSKREAKQSPLQKALHEAGATENWLITLAEKSGWAGATIAAIEADESWRAWAMENIEQRKAA